MQQDAYDALVGLSVGDAFGEQYIRLVGRYGVEIDQTHLLPAPWEWTDDTLMALSVYAVLKRDRRIDAQVLAQDFMDRYDPQRGYGPAVNRLLRQLSNGAALMQAAQQQFEGQGSYGNGAAMRVAPLGAFFAADMDEVVEQARISARPTHTHPEAIAGAIGVAVAAAYAVQLRGQALPHWKAFLRQVLAYIPPSEVASKVQRALSFNDDPLGLYVAITLGNGSAISAQDTVPYSLWCAARQLGDYESALWLTAQGLGDIDTTCAIVGGIVAGYTGAQAIPAMWLQAREPLPAWIEGA